MDALAAGGEEGRGKLRKASGSCKQALIRGCPNGGTWVVDEATHLLVIGGAIPGEVKHLSTRRKRNQDEIPLVAASERGVA